MQDWPVGWEEVDATSASDFREACRNGWAQVRAELEPRELDDALDQCDEGVADLLAMAADDTVCDELRALYVGP